MNIGFMIGNGFDISLGLKTKYTDFYSYYFKKENNFDNNILNAINKNIELWSNLEKSLGEYTSKISSDEKGIEKFCEDKYMLDCELRNYLRKEQDKIDWNDESNINEVRKKFLSCLQKFYNGFNTVDRECIQQIIGTETCYYKLISFNYTNVIQKCSELSQTNLIQTLYIHGELQENRTILGVNDVEQIANENLRNVDEVEVSLCKLKINEFYGEKIQIKAEQMIRSCGIICIFGMSLGETDKHWWNFIVDRLSDNYLKRVIIFHYDPDLDIDCPYKLLRTQKKIKDELLGYSKISEERKNLLRDRINVICNMNIFNLRLVFRNDTNLERMLKEKELVY